MRPKYFSKRHFWMWGFALFFLSVLALAYWYKWWKGEMNISWPILFTAVVGIVVWRSRYRKHLVFFCLAFYIIFSLKAILIDRQIALGLLFTIAAFALGIALEILFPDRENVGWLYQEGAIGDDTPLIMDIGLRQERQSPERKEHEPKRTTE